MITVVIVTYNSERYIKNCLQSILENSIRSKIEIVLVDNASQDKTLTIVRRFPKIRLIKNKINIGFASAVNQATAQAKGDILLLNPDTLIGEGVFDEFTSLSKKTSLAAISCSVRNFDGSFQPSCGNFPGAFNILLDRIPLIRNLYPKSEIIRSVEFYRKLQYPDWASGTCLFLRKKALKKVGGFDENYFMYLEDVDWCYRAKKAGFRILYTPDCNVIHADEGKSPKKSPNKFFNMRKGFITFFQKSKNPKELLIFKILLYFELFLKKYFLGPKSQVWLETYNKTADLI